MKLKKIFAALAATAVAATMAVSASAVDVNVDAGAEGAEINDDGLAVIAITAAGYNPLEVESVTITFTVDDSDGFGGGLMIQSDISGWEQKDGEWDWGNEGKNFNAEGADGKYSVTFNWGDYFTASGNDNIEWAQVVIQQWWGNSITITGVTVNMAKDDTPVENPPAQDPPAQNPPTGATAGLALAGLALAGAAIVATKKSK